MRRLLLASLLSAGCFSSSSAGDLDSDAGGLHSDAGARSRDAEVRRDTGLAEDAGAPFEEDAGVPCAPPRGEEIRLLEEEAECLGLLAAGCIDCHTNEGGDLVLRSSSDECGGVPAPLPAPGPIDVDACLLAECD